jgi:hypothetical protein
LSRRVLEERASNSTIEERMQGIPAREDTIGEALALKPHCLELAKAE